MYSCGSITAPVSYEGEGINLEWSQLSDFEAKCVLRPPEDPKQSFENNR